MHDHINIPEQAFKALNIDTAATIRALSLFGPSDEGPKHKGEFVSRRFNYINLLHYIDNKGPAFMIGQRTADQKIAKAIFDTLDASRKLVVYSYIEWIEDGDEDA